MAEERDKPLAWLRGEIKTPPFSKDKGHAWRIVYRVDEDAIVIGEMFAKTTRTTPRDVIDRCQRRLAAYDRTARERKKR